MPQFNKERNDSVTADPLKVAGHFDYIITGAGCAGLSLLLHLIHSGQFSDKKILLLDKDAKKANDRTWCFWEKGEGLFQPVVHHQWDHLLFYGKSFLRELDIAPYRYKMIRGIDFYNYCLEAIGSQPNIQFIQASVQHIFSSERWTGVIANDQTFTCNYVFNSILFDQPRLGKKEYWLLQHFKGWLIETANNVFDPAKATLMDFRTGQKNGTAFCYVLPLNKNRALIEYTLFSPALLQKEEYDYGLKQYINTVLNISDYSILEEEFGVIPMTNFRFQTHQNNIINIGTAGGHTKGSSGYTFQFIQKAVAKLVQRMTVNGYPYEENKRDGKYHFYDGVLLDILHRGSLEGAEVFTDLFKKNSPNTVLKFLDNDTSLKEELSIISTLPFFPFLKAAVRQLF